MMRTFYIPAEVYTNGITFCITKDAKKAANFISRKIDSDITEYNFDCLGKCFRRKNHTTIVWLPTFPRNPQETGTAVHEIAHAVNGILDWAHIELNNQTEECYTHLLGYFVREFFKIKNKQYVKKKN